MDYIAREMQYDQYGGIAHPALRCPWCGRLRDFERVSYDDPCKCGAVYYGTNEGQDHMRHDAGVSDEECDDAPMEVVESPLDDVVLFVHHVNGWELGEVCPRRGTNHPQFTDYWARKS